MRKLVPYLLICAVLLPGAVYAKSVEEELTGVQKGCKNAEKIVEERGRAMEAAFSELAKLVERPESSPGEILAKLSECLQAERGFRDAADLANFSYENFLEIFAKEWKDLTPRQFMYHAKWATREIRGLEKKIIPKISHNAEVTTKAFEILERSIPLPRINRQLQEPPG